MRWQKLQKEFSDHIKDTVGQTKFSSGRMDIGFDTDNHVTVELGGYDVGDWPRHVYLGPFETEDEAFAATSAKVAEAKAILDEEAKDIQGDI